MNEDQPKCNFLDCVSGFRLASMGDCWGEPGDPDCPEFEAMPRSEKEKATLEIIE